MEEQNTKKDNEKKLLDRFIKVYNEENDNPIELISPAEEPDFKVKYRKEVIGTEVTEIYREKGPKGSEIKRSEVFKNQFVNQVKKEFKKKCNNKFTVIFSLNDNAFKEPFKDEKILKKVADLIYKNIPQDEKNIIIEDKLFHAGLIDVISEISISTYSNSEHWTYIEAGTIGPAINDIITAINEKEDKYKNYLKHEMNPKEIWLVVIASGRHLSSSIDFERIKSGDFNIDTNFDRIYLFGYIEKEIIYLKE